MALFPELTDTEAWSSDDLEVLRQAVTNEIDRRLTISSAEQQIDELVRQYSAATGRKEGDTWSQPTGAHDSYPDRSRVTHNGKEWYSTIPGNVWEPGGSGWREYVEPDSGVVPEYLAPTGAHDAYMVGDKVTFRGRVYESVIDSNVYSPVEYAQGWVEIDPNAPVEEPEPEVPEEPEVPADPEPEPEPEPEPDPEPTPDPEPEEPEVPTVPAWKQPTGGHDAYKVGDRVLFEGSVYESVIAGNTWSPTGYPAGWKKI